MSLKDQILSADDSIKEPVDIPEWGSLKLFVRVLSGEERDDFEASMVQQRGKNTVQNLRNVRAKLAVRCLCDETGARIFEDADATALGKKSGSALQLVFEKARKLNRLTNEDVEELAGNS